MLNSIGQRENEMLSVEMSKRKHNLRKKLKQAAKNKKFKKFGDRTSKSKHKH